MASGGGEAGSAPLVCGGVGIRYNAVMKAKHFHPYPVVVSREGRWFVARCVEPSVTSQGRTQEEALRNVREAIELYIESFGPSGHPSSHPVLTHVEVAV